MNNKDSFWATPEQIFGVFLSKFLAFSEQNLERPNKEGYCPVTRLFIKCYHKLQFKVLILDLQETTYVAIQSSLSIY